MNHKRTFYRFLCKKKTQTQTVKLTKSCTFTEILLYCAVTGTLVTLADAFIKFKDVSTSLLSLLLVQT